MQMARQHGPQGRGRTPGRSKTSSSRAPIRIAIVDDDPRIHQTARRTVETLAIKWRLESHLNGEEAVERILHTPPAVVLMAISMSGLSGIECTRRVKAQLPRLPIVMLSKRKDPLAILMSIVASATGYLIKPPVPSQLVRSVRRALAGRPALCERAEILLLSFLRSAATLGSGDPLTRRELEILGCLLQHLPDKEIAGPLRISGRTVQRHLESIYHKLGVHTREAASRKFLGLGRVTG